jgi:hypothetical protein
VTASASQQAMLTLLDLSPMRGAQYPLFLLSTGGTLLNGIFTCYSRRRLAVDHQPVSHWSAKVRHPRPTTSGSVISPFRRSSPRRW